MTVRALLVDDEEPALIELEYRLVDTGMGVEVDTATTPSEALACLRTCQYDVVFLDVQMPGLHGLDLAAVINGLNEPPAIVFVTAHEEHALRAFELRALDYLLKPVVPERLRDTLARITARSGERDSRPRTIPPTVAGGPGTRLELLPVERAGKTTLIELNEICFVEARNEIAYVHTRDQVFPTRYTLNEVESRVLKPPFLRIHRSYLVNLRNVSEIRPYLNGAYIITCADVRSTELAVSRGHAKELRSLLQL